MRDIVVDFDEKTHRDSTCARELTKCRHVADCAAMFNRLSIDSVSVSGEHEAYAGAMRGGESIPFVILSDSYFLRIESRSLYYSVSLGRSFLYPIPISATPRRAIPVTVI